MDLGAVPHQLEEGNSASEDTGPRRGVDCDVPHWLGRRTNHHFKVLRESLKGKIQREQYVVAVDLGHYTSSMLFILQNLVIVMHHHINILIRN